MKNKAPRMTLYCDFCHTPKRVRMGNPDKLVTCDCGCETFNYNKDGSNEPEPTRQSQREDFINRRRDFKGPGEY